MTGCCLFAGKSDPAGDVTCWARVPIQQRQKHHRYYARTLRPSATLSLCHITLRPVMTYQFNSSSYMNRYCSVNRISRIEILTILNELLLMDRCKSVKHILSHKYCNRSEFSELPNKMIKCKSEIIFFKKKTSKTERDTTGT